MHFRLVSKSTTLDDLEGHSVSQCMRLSEPTMKIWMKIDPYCQQRRCSSMTVDSGNIRFMRIFAVTAKFVTSDGHFTLNFQCSFFTITNRVLAIRFHIYRRVIYRIFLLVWRHQQRSAEVYRENRDRQNIADPQKDCGSVVKKSWMRCIVGTLTKKANVTIYYYLVLDRLSSDSKTPDLEWP